MTITRRVSSYSKMATLWVAMVIAALCTSLGALFFFTAALLIWIDHYVGPAAAAALAGLALLLEAIAILIGCQLVLKRMRARQPGGLGGDFLGLAATGLRLATLTFRRSPRKALIVAMILGAVADYFNAGPDKKK